MSSITSTVDNLISFETPKQITPDTDLKTPTEEEARTSLPRKKKNLPTSQNPTGTSTNTVKRPVNLVYD